MVHELDYHEVAITTDAPQIGRTLRQLALREKLGINILALWRKGGPVFDLADLPLEAGDVLLACSDGLWSGLSDEDMAEISANGENNLVDNLKALSMKALNVNSPYSDNTTGTAIRWLGV